MAISRQPCRLYKMSCSAIPVPYRTMACPWIRTAISWSTTSARLSTRCWSVVCCSAAGAWWRGVLKTACAPCVRTWIRGNCLCLEEPIMKHSTWHLLGCVVVFALLGSLVAPALARITQVGLVTDVGKVDDRTFNEFAYQGMMRAVKEFGLKSAFIETQQPTDYEKNIEQFAATGYEMIITVGFMVGATTKKMAVK